MSAVLLSKSCRALHVTRWLSPSSADTPYCVLFANRPSLPVSAHLDQTMKRKGDSACVPTNRSRRPRSPRRISRHLSPAVDRGAVHLPSRHRAAQRRRRHRAVGPLARPAAAASDTNDEQASDQGRISATSTRRVSVPVGWYGALCREYPVRRPRLHHSMY